MDDECLNARGIHYVLYPFELKMCNHELYCRTPVSVHLSAAHLILAQVDIALVWRICCACRPKVPFPSLATVCRADSVQLACIRLRAFLVVLLSEPAHRHSPQVHCGLSKPMAAENIMTQHTCDDVNLEPLGGERVRHQHARWQRLCGAGEGGACPGSLYRKDVRKLLSVFKPAEACRSRYTKVARGFIPRKAWLGAAKGDAIIMISAPAPAAI